jgi:hypothetical protein
MIVYESLHRYRKPLHAGRLRRLKAVDGTARAGSRVPERICRPHQRYLDAHEGPGVDAENAISGNTRIDVNGKAPTSTIKPLREKDGTPVIGAGGKTIYSGAMDIRYNVGGKIVTVRHYVERNNITSIDQDYKPK